MAPPQRNLAPPPADAPAASGRGLAAWLVRWRLALRMARRDARRAKGRTTLVLLMVGLPVLAIVAGDSIYRTTNITAVESLPARLGSADALIQGYARDRIYADPVWGGVYEGPQGEVEPWTADEVRAALPTGSEVVERLTGSTVYRTGIGYAYVQAYADDLRAPIRDGAFRVVQGRVPAADGEVAVSDAVAERGFAVGDRIEVTRDDVAMTVVGVLSADGQAGAPYLVMAPEAADLLPGSVSEFFAAVPGGLDWPAVQELNGKGLAVVSRDVVLDPPPASETMPPGWGDGGAGASSQEIAVLALVVVALLLQVVLLAGPAFAVGLRRQRRDLALLAASGGTPADLRRAVLASGLLLGVGAAVLGALLGVGVARLGVSVLEDRTSASVGPFEVAPLDVLGVVLVGAIAGLAAAWVPARQAARTDVVTTLSGRRGQVRSSWRLPLAGVVVAGAGLALSVLGAQGTELAVAGGAVLLVVGVVMATPWLVGLLAPLARRLPVAGRLAVRDATRNRSRTAPAVAAVMATVAGITTLAIGSASDSAQGRRDYVPQLAMGTAAVSLFDSDQEGWDAALRAVEQHTSGRPVHELRTMVWSEDDMREMWVLPPGATGSLPDIAWYDQSGVFASRGQIALVDVEAMAAITASEVRAPAVAALRQGRAVVFGDGAVDDEGRVTVEVTRLTGRTQESLGRVDLPAVEISPPAGARQLLVPGTIVVPPELADRLPVDFRIAELLVGSPDEPITAAEETRLREAITGLTSESSVYVERGWSDELWLVRLLLVLVGGVLVLVATLTATGLAVADARPDLATLAAIGAAPRTRRFMAMGSAAVIGIFGAVLGVLAGLAPGIAVAYPLTSNIYGAGGAEPVVVIPWDLLAAVALGVPLLAVLVTGLVVRSRLPMATRITP